MIMPANILSHLRRAMPDRPLSLSEAYSVAERQALTLLHLAEIEGPRVSEDIITDLPRIRVRQLLDLPTSGMSFYERGLWHIAINGADSRCRQRFTLAHEFKHILDHPFASTIYRRASDAQVERICDFFAGCLLIPRPLLKRAWTARTQKVSDLAHLFDVSPQAMQVRLSQTGLIAPTPRCFSRPRTYTRPRRSTAALATT
jgi:Zn-dependent peptidase ImmA (M78 family)